MDKYYSWNEVCSWLGIEYREHGNYAIKCPCCDPDGEKQPKLYVNADIRSFYCHRCGSKGGIVDLYALFRNISFDEAKREMRERRKGTSFGTFQKIKTVSNEAETKASEQVASLGILQKDLVYEAMVEHLKLTYNDRVFLRKED